MLTLALYGMLITLNLGLLNFIVQELLQRRRLRQPKVPQMAPVLVDGSNVVMWLKNAGMETGARLDTLVSVLDQLADEGKPARVIFDATIGYNLEGRFLHEGDLRRRLRRPGVSIKVVPKGTTADAALLDEAVKTGSPIVTNDRYRDHALHTQVRLRTGHFSAGKFRVMG